MTLKRLLIVSFACVCINMTYAQVLSGNAFAEEFKAQVKSLDEFRARFNGEEGKPGVADDENARRNNIISLLDFKMDKGSLSREEFTKKLNDFVDSVLINNVEFKVSDAGLWAECECRLKFKNKNIKLTLILQSESYKKDMFRWAVVAVKGLDKAGILNTEKYYAISPAEHEIHFMGLQDYLNANPKRAFGYRYRTAKIDPLSVFFTLVSTGLLEFNLVEKQTFHFFDIPGYVISIKEFNREGFNSGWLISSFEKVNDEEKIQRANGLFGYDDEQQ